MVKTSELSSHGQEQDKEDHTRHLRSALHLQLQTEPSDTKKKRRQDYKEKSQTVSSFKS